MRISRGAAVDTSPDRVVFDTALVRIGAFRCRPDDRSFEDSGPIENDCFVFPRTAVVIEHDHERAFVANPNIVTFYNTGDRYRRLPIDADGDRCDWFAVRRDVAVDIAGSLDPAARDDGVRPFRWTHAMSDARAYAAQRRLFDTVTRATPSEPLEIEEGVVWLLERVMRNAAVQRLSSTSARETSRHADLVHDTKTLLSRQFGKGLSLAEIASELDVSVFHLCRVFRRLTGCTLHEYRHQLRLRWSLERIAARPPHSLVRCALDAGFSSHSHYGAAFKRAFGQTPTEFRRGASSEPCRTSTPGSVASDR